MEKKYKKKKKKTKKVNLINKEWKTKTDEDSKMKTITLKNNFIMRWSEG